MKILVEIETAGTDLSMQKNIDLLREALSKYYNWAISSVKIIEQHKIDVNIKPLDVSNKN